MSNSSATVGPGVVLGGRYRVDKRLGRGGMATVYHGRDPILDRDVAIKVLGSFAASATGSQEDFLREARTTAALTHPNIVHVYDAGVHGAERYIVMEYVSGGTLFERLQARSALPVDEAVAIATQLADALDYAHRRGIVHCDVKPQNVLLDESDHPKLVDLGISRSLATSGALIDTVAGTAGYIAPEQLLGERIDGRVDVYALGCVVYEMLSGTLPFEAASLAALAAQRFERPPTPLAQHCPDLPGPLVDAVMRAIARSPDQRYPSAQAFREALTRARASIDELATARFERPSVDRTWQRLPTTLLKRPHPAGEHPLVRPQPAPASPAVAAREPKGVRGPGIAELASSAAQRYRRLNRQVTPPVDRLAALARARMRLIWDRTLAANRHLPGYAQMIGAVVLASLILLLFTHLPGARNGSAAAAHPVQQRHPAQAAAPASAPGGSAAQAMSVTADDGAAQSRVEAARTALNAVVSQFNQDYGLAAKRPLTIHLASDQSTARSRLGAFGDDAASIDSFFQDGGATESVNTASGVEALIYLPNSNGLRGDLGLVLAAYTLSTAGGSVGRADTPYPWWFERGFAVYQLARFTNTGRQYHTRALADVRAGTAPALAAVSSDANAQAYMSKHRGGLPAVDARSEAAVEWLAQNYGQAAVGRLIQANAAGSIAQFDDLLQRITGMSLNQLDLVLNRWLQQ